MVQVPYSLSICPTTTKPPIAADDVKIITKSHPILKYSLTKNGGNILFHISRKLETLTLEKGKIAPTRIPVANQYMVKNL
jgi:hypothetical protein